MLSHAFPFFTTYSTVLIMARMCIMNLYTFVCTVVYHESMESKQYKRKWKTISITIDHAERSMVDPRSGSYWGWCSRREASTRTSVYAYFVVSLLSLVRPRVCSISSRSTVGGCTNRAPVQ